MINLFFIFIFILFINFVFNFINFLFTINLVIFIDNLDFYSIILIMHLIFFKQRNVHLIIILELYFFFIIKF